MSVVSLVSGGLDSSLMAFLIRDEGIEQFPLFLAYGQRSMRRELAACRRVMRALELPPPKVGDLAGFGALISSGLTDQRLRLYEDAFLPGRNLLFLLVASSYAVQRGATTVAIGLLNEDSALFPDQTEDFLRESERLLSSSIGQAISVVAPLSGMRKVDVVALAKRRRIRGTYSCHAGALRPCGLCIACREYDLKEG